MIQAFLDEALCCGQAHASRAARDYPDFADQPKGFCFSGLRPFAVQRGDCPRRTNV